MIDPSKDSAPPTPPTAPAEPPASETSTSNPAPANANTDSERSSSRSAALPSPAQLYAALEDCLIADARRIHARIRHLERDARLRTPSRAIEPQVWELVSEIDRSRSRAQERARSVPTVNYPGDLPVSGRREEIIRAIREHQVVVVCGATGSGKTTQLPKMCLEAGLGVRGLIGHTQPRRIAARSVASRIAHELGTRIGDRVGFKVRFTDHVSERTLVKVMTDGILLAETQGDRYLSQYDTLIVDEAHERSLNIDFLLGYLRQLLPRRPDLRVIVTSATIDPARFAKHFALPGRAEPPVIEVSGRTYPVEVRYRPLDPGDGAEARDVEQGVIDAVTELWREPVPTGAGATGDVLVFLPGEREIRETAEELRKHHPRGCEIVPLYARLSADEQQRVFDRAPGGPRRVVLATNVAETSLTVPGISYVVDAGIARISRYSPRIKVQRLPIEPVSKASANQRAGRCGRTHPGVCIRLYSQDDFDRRPDFTDPEILRTNLASVILQMKALDLGEIEDFPFLEPPDARSIRDGYDTLLEIGALEGGGLRAELTDIGRKLARLPIDPRIGRMLIAAGEYRCVSEVLIIAAALSTQDPRERPIQKQTEADAAHAKFKDEQSDFVSILKLWSMAHAEQKKASGSQFRRWCSQHFISYMRLREWQDVERQLRAQAGDMDLHPAQRPASYEALHKALLTGLLSSIGRKVEREPAPPGSTRTTVKKSDSGGLVPGDYQGARNTSFAIFPGSGLFKKPPKWLVAAEIVKTTRTYARTAAQIRPEWIEQLAQHLVKRTYHDPHWAAEIAQVCAYETVSLFGLEIIKRRRVNFGPIDPAQSRAIFIQHALVNGEYLTPAKFFEHNHRLTGQVKELQERTRTTDLLADQTRRFEFYDKRLPADAVAGPEFEHWRRKAEARQPDLLIMTKADVLAPGVELPAPEQFPSTLTLGEHTLALEYKHEPGHIDDGVTIIVPVDAVGELTSQRLDWLVPGLLNAKVETLIRELPKHLRVSFVPVPQVAEAAVSRMPFAQGELLPALTAALRELKGIYVGPEQFKPDALAPHLKMNIRVVDDKGAVVLNTRDLAVVRKELAVRAERSVVRLPAGPFNRAGVFHWDFGPLPERLEMEHDRRTLTLFPALVDESTPPKSSSGSSQRIGCKASTSPAAVHPADFSPDVAIRLFADAAQARLAHAGGLSRLFFLHTRRECRSLVQTTPGIERLILMAAARAELSPLAEHLAELVAARAWVGPDAEPPADIRDKESFESRSNVAWTRIGSAGAEVLALAEKILTLHAAIAPTVDSLDADQGAAAIDLKVQLAYLFPTRFWTLTPFLWLSQYPRYLDAIRRRLERLGAPGTEAQARDTRAINELAPLVHRLRIRVEQGTPSQRADPDLVLYRWMLEEFRTSLFAQQQKTLVPVSVKRLDQQWEKVVAKDA